MRRLISIPMIALISMTAGCGDYFMRREANFGQTSTTNNTVGNHWSTFDIDLSQIPPSWIEKQTVVHHPWGDETDITFDHEHPVKIVLVPGEKRQD